MYDFLRLSNEDKRIVFRNTAQKRGFHESIVEKDFWVCLTLDYLFHENKWKDSFVFKGGTSLSKAYGLIRRFSEDIDIILDWRVLGYSKDEPWEERSNSKQDAFNKEANRKAEVFLREDLLPVLRQDLQRIIGQDANLYISPEDPQTICFSYPRIFETSSILPVIRMEIGALAAWTPAQVRKITPYAAECYPNVFKSPATEIFTVAPERTFWEKATILHHEANRPEHLMMPARYSRHYYDMYCLFNSDVKDSAMNDLELLKQVVNFKMKFYPRKWAKYEEAVPGTMKLLPPENRFSDLKKDYDDMHAMFFGEVISFDEIVNKLEELEAEINNMNK